MKIAEICRTSTFAWSHDSLPLLALGTVAGAVDLSFSSQAALEIWNVFSPLDKTKPVVELAVDARFHALAWSKPFDKFSQGVIVGGFENGAIEFWDAASLVQTQDLQKLSIHRDTTAHPGFVKSLLFHPAQDHVLVSGGDKGHIFVWDLKKLQLGPTSPGQAMTPMEVISSLAWNRSVPHIFASTGNSGFTSVWDLKAKREILHLSYQGPTGTRANFSCVAWHPTESTKLITATDNDGSPLIMTWDLRNSNAPEKIMTGHTQGVLSLDWCSQDPELLISSGKDNSTLLWNPLTGEKLGEYPTTANWAFLTRFAPQAPDVFATASFDGKIVVQSLQDTSPPVLLNNRLKSDNDDQFWNDISTTDTQIPTFEKRQAPKWLKNPCSVGFGFGSKLVEVRLDASGKSVVEVEKFNNYTTAVSEDIAKLATAIKDDNFKGFIESKTDFVNEVEEADWELLKRLTVSGSRSLLDKEIQLEETTDVEPSEQKATTTNGSTKDTDEDSFFDNLGSVGVKKAEQPHVPSGEFSIFADDGANEKIVRLILGGKIDQAVFECIEENLLLEALVLALEGSKESKELVKNEYFKQHQNHAISRLLYSASSKDVTDIVANAKVENWKEIAASISAYATDKDDFNHKITELGDRIMAAGGKREDAILCYAAGNALDRISSIWLKEFADLEQNLLKSDKSKATSPSDARFEALTVFVEKLAAYKNIANIKGIFSGPNIDGVCKILLEYANAVVGFGEFELAESFLDLLPEEFAGLKLEKDRIAKATNKKPAQPVAQGGRGHASMKGPTGATGRVNAYMKSPTGKTARAIGGSSLNSLAPIVTNSNRPPHPTSFGQPVAVPNYGGVANPYGKPIASVAPANPYAPQVSTVPAAYNGYKPITPGIQGSFVPPPSPVGGSSSLPSPPPPASSTLKKDEGGWNDLPETFKSQVAPRKSAVSVPNVPSPVPTPQPKRTPSAVAPVLPPPPKGISRSSSKQTVPTHSATSSPHAAHALLNTRYAPPPSLNSVAPSFPESPGKVALSGPIRNPYAPPPALAPTRASYAQPPTPTIGYQAQPAPTTPLAPPKNPYAPLVTAGISRTSRASSASFGGAVPPPPPVAPGAVISPPPPVFGSIPPPPPAVPGQSGLNGVSTNAPPPLLVGSSGQPAAVTPPPPAHQTKPTHPAGDRSHISDESLPVYTTLNNILKDIMPDLPAQYAKHGEAVVRRLDILFDRLNNAELSDEVVQALLEVCEFLAAKDYKLALASHLDLTTKHSEEASNWHPGVKHLIQMAEALQ